MCSGVSHIALRVFLEVVGLIRTHLSVRCPWSLSLAFFFFFKQDQHPEWILK